MNESTYAFGTYRLAPARRELFDGDRLLTVQPRVFDTLTYLLQHRDRAIGRDELIAAVWGRVEITDSVLRHIVARARQAVGDTADEQHTLRTLPRFGYRWVREIDVESTAPIPEIVRRPEPVRRGSRPARALSVLGLALLLVRASSEVPPRSRAPAPAPVVAASTPTESPAQRRAAIAAPRGNGARTIPFHVAEAEDPSPEARYEAARRAFEAGQVDGALVGFEALLADLGSHAGPSLIAGKTWYMAGQAEARRGNADKAQHHYREAIQRLAGQTGQEAAAILGRSWTSLGGQFSARHAFAQADAAYAQARAALERSADAAAQGQLENSLGIALYQRYRDADAESHFLQAIERAAAATDPNLEARARMNLINVQLQGLQPTAALASVARLRDLRERIGDPMLAAHVDLVRAKVLVANGRLTEADRLLRTNAGRPIAADAGLASLRDMIAAELAFARGALDQGAEHVRALLASPGYSPDDGMAAYARWRLLVARRAVGDRPGMAEAASAAEAQSRAEPADPTIRIYALLARGEAAAATGNLTRAHHAFGQALTQAEATHVPFDVVQAAARYAQFLIQQGDRRGARRIADRVGEWADRDYAASLIQLSVYHATGSEAWRWAWNRTRWLAGERAVPAGLGLPPITAEASFSPASTDGMTSHLP